MEATAAVLDVIGVTALGHWIARALAQDSWSGSRPGQAQACQDPPAMQAGPWTYY